MGDTRVETPLFSFVLIADVQYADVDNGQNYSKTKYRYYRNSINLLGDAIKAWNSRCPKPSFMFQLGDLIDGQNKRHKGMSLSSWKKATKTLSHFEGKVYHTFGNHEYYNFTHKEIAQMLPSMTLSRNEDAGLIEVRNQPRLRYSFSPHEKFIFVVLDTYEIGMLGYDQEEPEYIKGKEMLTSVNKGPVRTIYYYNCFSERLRVLQVTSSTDNFPIVITSAFIQEQTLHLPVFKISVFCKEVISVNCCDIGSTHNLSI